jgi:iron uptake system component EfeO
MKLRTPLLGLPLLLACSSASSSSDAKTDADYQAAAVTGMHDALAADIDVLLASAKRLQDAAPTPAGRGWDAQQDAVAIASMRSAWRDCRVAYEHVEGALAPIFPDIDASIDARYDDLLATLGGKGDANLMDDQGVTGMHAIERILYAPTIRKEVTNFEQTLPGYALAAFPRTEAEALSFKTKLVGKLIADVTRLRAEWQPASIDIGVAFQGLIALMNEQREKVNKAATGEEESRYADMTLFDLRNNLDGTAKVYAIFQPWIRSKSGTSTASSGAAADASIQDGFGKLGAFYGGLPGDAVPAPPTTWSSLHPTQADLETPFGQLFTSVTTAVSPTQSGSIVFEMNAVASLLGFPEFKEGG